MYAVNRDADGCLCLFENEQSWGDPWKVVVSWKRIDSRVVRVFGVKGRIPRRGYEAIRRYFGSLGYEEVIWSRVKRGRWIEKRVRTLREDS